MDPRERERLEALNTDHHRRMDVMHVGHSPDQMGGARSGRPLTYFVTGIGRYFSSTMTYSLPGA